MYSFVNVRGMIDCYWSMAEIGFAEIIATYPTDSMLFFTAGLDEAASAIATTVPSHMP